jgi:hypothetical protein
MPEAYNVLENLEVLEVSLVPKAANKRKFLVMKSEEALMGLSNDFKEALEKAGLSAEDIEGVGEVLALLADKKVPTEATAKALGIELTEKPDETKKSDGKLEMDQLPVEIKSQVEKLFKQNEELTAKAAEVEKQLADERDKREAEEYVRKAEAEYAALPGTAQVNGRLIRVAKKAMSDTDYAEFEKLLKAANEAFVALGKNTGSSGSNAPTGVSARIEALAKELVAKNEAPTYAQAFDLVMKRNPALYKEFLSEGGRN